MSQSLTKIITHITFSTKHRQPLIDESIEPSLYAYLGGVCNELDCLPIKIGGYVDHVHILCFLSKKIALIKLLEEIKRRSSKWVKTEGASYEQFYWQDGYGAFSVNPAEIDVVVRYIEGQYTHHQKISFQDEYRAFLKSIKLSLMNVMFGIRNLIGGDVAPFQGLGYYVRVTQGDALC